MPPLNKVLIVLCAALVVAGAVTLVAGMETPEGIGQLEEAQRAGEEASDLSGQITRSLENIAANLGEGADLSAQSEKIRSLTARQRESLAALVDILSDQLERVRDSTAALQETQQSAAEVAELSASQARTVEATVQALRAIRRSAREARTFSAQVARLTAYAARLAEDSADHFSGP